MQTLNAPLPFLLLLSCLSVSACMTPEQIAEQRARQEQADTRTCLEYGFKPNSEGFSSCRLELDLARERRNYPSYYGAYGYGGGHYHPHFSYSHWY